jgi:hypothetical protein
VLPGFSSRFGQGGLKSGVDLVHEFPQMFFPEELVGQNKAEFSKKIKLSN